MQVGGVSLVGRAVRVAKAAGIGAVYVSTDDAAIAAEAQSHGATLPFMRPADLATDQAAKLPVIEHLIAHLESAGNQVDWVVDLQPTTPLRQAADVQACIDLALSLPPAEQGLVTTVYDPGVSPYFTQVQLAGNGRASLCMQSTATRRQDTPAVWALNGAVYVWQRAALAKAAVHGIWSVPVHTVVMPRERSADIDDALDLDWANFLCARHAKHIAKGDMP